jgi:hypothetical protein
MMGLLASYEEQLLFRNIMSVEVCRVINIGSELVRVQ